MEIAVSVCVLTPSAIDCALCGGSAVTYNTLCVAILSTHRQVQSERIRVDNINVTGFRTAQGVDTAIEWFVGAHLDSDSGVFAVYGNCHRETDRKIKSFCPRQSKESNASAQHLPS